MICPPCKEAGRINQVANSLATLEGMNAAEGDKQAARDLHAKCEYLGTCTCAHIVGEVLSWDEIRDLKASGANVPDFDAIKRSADKSPADRMLR